MMMMMMIVALCMCVCVCQSLETQMATFFHSFFLSCCVRMRDGYCLQKSPPPHNFLVFSFGPSSSPYRSILNVAISERLLLLLLMGDVNHRCAQKKPRERENEGRKEERKACRCCLPILRHRSRSGVMHVHLTLLSSCNQRYLRFSLLLRRRVMTRKERGEDVYRCSMLGQTLNDESSQKSNPINCIVRQTKKKKGRKEKKERKMGQ